VDHPFHHRDLRLHLDRLESRHLGLHGIHHLLFRDLQNRLFHLHDRLRDRLRGHRGNRLDLCRRHLVVRTLLNGFSVCVRTR